MARNQEKAQSTLSRWLAQQKAESGQPTQKQKRPHLASLVDTVKEAEKWRNQILREVSSQVVLIQNGTKIRLNNMIYGILKTERKTQSLTNLI